jgi:hypothetical protein
LPGAALIKRAQKRESISARPPARSHEDLMRPRARLAALAIKSEYDGIQQRRLVLAEQTREEDTDIYSGEGLVNPALPEA